MKTPSLIFLNSILNHHGNQFPSIVRSPRFCGNTHLKLSSTTKSWRMYATPMVVPDEKKVYSTKADIRPLYKLMDDYNPFTLISDDVCLDPHDEENNFDYIKFRSKNGARLDRSIATNDFILVGFDKCAISAVLDIPVPPGASLSVKMSTWCNSCHDDYGIAKSHCFGVGMVPYGEGKEQEWLRGGMKTCIENGIQYSSQLSIERMMFGGGSRAALGGFGGSGLSSMVEHSYEVMQKGCRLEHYTNKVVPLDVIDVKISYDKTDNEFEFSFVQAGDTFNIKCPAKDDNPNMQLYFNCLSWADNNTYVQIHEVIYEPPSIQGKLVSKKIRSVKHKASEVEDAFPDYNKMLKADPELQAKVDAAIKTHTTKQNED